MIEDTRDIIGNSVKNDEGEMTRIESIGTRKVKKISDSHHSIKDNDSLRDGLSGLIEKCNNFALGENSEDTNNDNRYNTKCEEIYNLPTSYEVIPPENFCHIAGEMYRSSFPRTENFSFLRQRIKLKSILVLIPEEYPRENVDFMESSGIKLFQVGMSGNKEPFANIPSKLLTKALEIAINPENHPILIHCNRGKHRTGCLVGCIRKLQNWSLTMIFDEYRRFAFPKARALDQQFIEMYDDKEIVEIANKNHWLPVKW